MVSLSTIAEQYGYDVAQWLLDREATIDCLIRPLERLFTDDGLLDYLLHQTVGHLAVRSDGLVVVCHLCDRDDVSKRAPILRVHAFEIGDVVCELCETELSTMRVRSSAPRRRQPTSPASCASS